MFVFFSAGGKPKKKMKKKKYVNSGTVSSHSLSEADVDFLSPALGLVV